MPPPDQRDQFVTFVRWVQLTLRPSCRSHDKGPTIFGPLEEREYGWNTAACETRRLSICN